MMWRETPHTRQTAGAETGQVPLVTARLMWYDRNTIYELAGGATLVFRQMTGTRSSGGQRQPTARQVLDERFARGEISREEYEEIRAQIER